VRAIRAAIAGERFDAARNSMPLSDFNATGNKAASL